ncbi:hypothetical protein CK203_057738 [Vitis vinifera]|uniref:Uncharacterized protein n=1 Tax=Vitis vinifera TaxID=29760 RepID=A0A438GMB2_VITVI|nr:hypothetical protein CK203_057738 [Vitis vinifera]
MCGGDDHLAWKHPISLEACKELRIIRCLDFPYWVRVEGRLVRFSEILDMDQQVVMVDQFTTTMASIQEALSNLSSAAWDDLEGILVASLPAKFRMPEIERCTGVGCPHIHLLLYKVVDRPSEIDQIQMVLRSLQPRIARHVVGVPFTDFDSLVLALYDVEDDILRGLWTYASPTDVKGKKPSREQRSSDPYDQAYLPPTLELPYYATQGIKRLPISYPTPVQPCYTTQFATRPPVSYPRPRVPQTFAPFVLRTQRQFSQLGMPLSRALWKLTEVGLLTTLASRPLPQPIPPQLRMDLHCVYHQGPGHETNHCTALRHAIQDLIDRGLVHLDVDEIHTLVVDDVHTPDIQYVICGASSNTHRDALIRALSQIKVETTTTLEGLIHMMTVGKATCIVFYDDDLPPEGLDHTCPLQSEHMIALRGRFGHNGDRVIDRAGAIPSSLYQKVKFIHDGQVVTMQSIGDMLASSELVLQISHNENDLFLIGFSFDEVHTLEIEDFCKDTVAMSFDQHSSTVVLDMMRSMSYLPDIGLGRRQHGPNEFIAIPDHDVSFGLEFISTEVNYQYVARLRKERLSDGALGTSTSALATPSPPDRMSLVTLYFLDEVNKHGIFVKIGDMVDEVVPHNEYTDKILMMNDEIAQHDSNDDSSTASDPGPIDQSVPLTIGDTEVVNFDTANQPRELRIGLDLSTDERDSLV